MKTTEIIIIGNHTWKVTITKDHQVSIAFSLPKKWSSWKNNSLWQSWDLDDSSSDEEWVTQIQHTTEPVSVHRRGKTTLVVEEIKTDTLPVFKLMPKVMEQIARIAKQRKLNFFYFRANTSRKGRIYKRLCEKMCHTLGDGWESQVIDDGWFYFRHN